MANALYMPAALQGAEIFGVFSDFTEDQADTQFIDTVTDSGSVAMGDAVGGVATLTPSDCSVADNDEAYLACPNEVFLLAAGKPMYAEAKLRFTEVAAGVANVGFFFMNAIGANAILDTAGGLKVSGSTLGIYKPETTTWRCASANNGASTVGTAINTATAATDYVLGIEVYDIDSLSVGVAFTVDGIRLKDSNLNDLVHTVLVASATEMQVGVGIKLGAGTNNDTLLVDYLGAWQTR